jgi:tetratricopeptide (TPR) repeat protein
VNAVIDWQTSLGVLVAGLVVGAVLLWRLRRAPAAAAAPDTRDLDARDLEAKRDALLRQLRELDDTAAKRTPEQLARERHELEHAAARVLRDLDRHAPAPSSGPASAAVLPAAAAAGVAVPPNAAARGFFWGVATATALAALVFFVSRAANPREEGGSLTGTVGPMAAPPGGPAASGGGTGGADVDAWMEQARAALNRQDLMGVWNQTQLVLDRHPGHPRALAYQALVRLAMGQADVAEAMLKQAMQAEPELIEAYLHLGVVYARTGRLAEAERTVRSAMSRFPDEREGLERLLVELRNMPPDEGAPGPAHAGVAPPDDVHAGAAPPMMETAEAAPGTPARLSGTVEMDGSARARAGAGGLVFVIVRAAGVTSGPPVAVKRFPAASLPGAFAITSADSMLGQELPESVSIDARLDPDGDPLTRSPSDPAARIDGVKLGTTGLRLVLK